MQLQPYSCNVRVNEPSQNDCGLSITGSTSDGFDGRLLVGHIAISAVPITQSPSWDSQAWNSTIWSPIQYFI